MAILQDIKVTINVDGQILEEYEDDNGEQQSPDSITRYVSAASGTDFAICISLLEYDFPSDLLACDLYFEGKLIESFPLHPEMQPKILVEGCMVQGANDSERWYLQRFQFIDLEVVKDPESAPLLKRELLRSKRQGSILARIYETELLSEVPEEAYRSGNFEELSENQKVLKRAHNRDRLTHGVKLGGPEEVGKVRLVKTSHNRYFDVPIATFTFKYRSRDALKTLNLLPCSHPPTPVEESPIEYKVMTREQLLEQVQQLREQTGTKANKEKEEFNQSKKRARDEEVNETLALAQPKRAKTRPFAEGELLYFSD